MHFKFTRWILPGLVFASLSAFSRGAFPGESGHGSGLKVRAALESHLRSSLSRFDEHRDDERYFKAILKRNGISKRDSERLLGRYREAGSTRAVQAHWTDGRIELKDGANAAFFGSDDYRRGSATINGHRFQWDRNAGLDSNLARIRALIRDRKSRNASPVSAFLAFFEADAQAYGTTSFLVDLKFEKSFMQLWFLVEDSYDAYSDFDRELQQELASCRNGASSKDDLGLRVDKKYESELKKLGPGNGRDHGYLELRSCDDLSHYHYIFKDHTEATSEGGRVNGTRHPRKVHPPLDDDIKASVCDHLTKLKACLANLPSGNSGTSGIVTVPNYPAKDKELHWTPVPMGEGKSQGAELKDDNDD